MNLNDQDKQWLLAQLRAEHKDTADLINGVKDSLETDLADFRKEVNGRFDGLETAIKRHDAGVLAANIGVNGTTKAQTKTEQTVRDLVAIVHELRRRVRKLEGRKAK